MKRIGFAGLGTMGLPMAGHVLAKHPDTLVWNRSPEKAESLRAKGAEVAESLEALAKECDLIILCLGRSEDVAECAGEIGDSAAPGTIVVDHSTIAPHAAQDIHEDLLLRDIGFVDAPMTGGSMGAQAGTLTLFCAGRKDDYDAVLPALSCYSKRAEYVGESGRGQLMKCANQIAVGGALLGLCESLSFAKKAGLDLAQVRELVGSGAGGSWAFENYGPKILNEDWSPGFSVKNQQKDFGYCLEAADDVDAAIPGTMLTRALLSLLEAEGNQESTTARLYEKMLDLGFSG